MGFVHYLEKNDEFSNYSCSLSTFSFSFIAFYFMYLKALSLSMYTFKMMCS
jgi:hypothetical protein